MLAPVTPIEAGSEARIENLAQEYKRAKAEADAAIRRAELVADELLDAVESTDSEEIAVRGVRVWLHRTPEKPGYVDWKAYVLALGGTPKGADKFRRPTRSAKAEWKIEFSRERSL